MANNVYYERCGKLFPYLTIMDRLAAARETDTLVCRISLGDSGTVLDTVSYDSISKTVP